MTSAADHPLEAGPDDAELSAARRAYVKPTLVEDDGWDVITGTPISVT